MGGVELGERSGGRRGWVLDAKREVERRRMGTGEEVGDTEEVEGVGREGSGSVRSRAAKKMGA